MRGRPRKKRSDARQKRERYKACVCVSAELSFPALLAAQAAQAALLRKLTVPQCLPRLSQHDCMACRPSS